MRIINSSIENITPGSYDLESIYKHIEFCGRTCYKSQDKITDKSYEKFCKMIEDRGHTSVFEHGTVYLKITCSKPEYTKAARVFENNKYTKCATIYVYDNSDTPTKVVYVTTNMRVILQNGLMEHIKTFICKPSVHHTQRHTYRIICSRAIANELVRHRVMSPSQESQRYVNYSLDKFGKEITYIKPHWLKDEYVERFSNNIGECGEFMYDYIESEKEIATAASYINYLNFNEEAYFDLLDKGLKPENARGVLANDTKTEIVMTGFADDWYRLLDLRCAKDAHPDIQIIANMIKEDLNYES